MSNTDFDLAEFQAKVIACIHELEVTEVGVVKEPDRGRRAASVASEERQSLTREEAKHTRESAEDKRLHRRLQEAEAELARIRSIEAIESRETKALDRQKRREEAKQSLGQATELVKQRNIRTTLCPALKSISNDVFDISK